MSSKNTSKTPVIILTGFLGSGKTSFLTRLLRLGSMSNSAVIINEFGEHSLDHLLVNHVSDHTFELPGGCLCCNARGKLVDKMVQLDMQLDGKELHFDKLIIETSGVADTRNLVSTLWNDPHIRYAYRLENIVTVVSAVEWNAAFVTNDEFTGQLVLGDIVAISKADLLDEYSKKRQLGQLEAAIASINPAANIALLPLSDDDLNAVLSCGYNCLASDITPASDGHNSLAFKTMTLAHDIPVAQSDLALFLDILLSRHSANLLRVKGLVFTKERPGEPLVVQAVGSTNSPVDWLTNWPSFPATQLTIIHTDNIERQIVQLFNSMFGVPAPDQPDAVALTDNPLSITGLGTFDPGKH